MIDKFPSKIDDAPINKFKEITLTYVNAIAERNGLFANDDSLQKQKDDLIFFWL